MSKKNILSAKDLLAKKKFIDEKKETVYFSETFDGNIQINEDVPLDEIAEIFNDNSLSEYDRYIRIIYECCPLFKEQDFRDAYPDIKEPYDIVKNIFKCTGSEVYELGNKILVVYGFIKAELIEKIKKQ